MNAILGFLQTHGVLLLSGLIALLWYLFLFRYRPRSFIRFAAFPISHFRLVLDVRENPYTIPITLCYLIFAGGIASIVSSSDPHAFLIGWCLALLYELSALTAYFLIPKSKRILLVCSVIILLFVGYGAIKTIQAKDFQIMNNFDFAAQVYIFIGSILAVAGIIIKDRFAKEVDAFFVFFGLIIYSFLQSLSTIMLAFDFVQNFDFAYYATLITLLFWLVSIPWVKRLKSRLT